MRYFVEVNGRPHEVEVTERLGELHVSVDGRVMDLDYREVDTHGQASVLLGNESFAVSVEGGRNQCLMTIAGQLFQVDIEDERERAAHAAERAAARGGGVVKSVMPGVVVSVLVAEGDSVEAGQPLLILEAMKMQNEIGAPSSGVVKRIHVAEGAAVGAGAELVGLEAPAEG